MISSDVVRSDDVLVKVHEGMAVYGSDGNRIGTIRYTQFADQSVDGYIYVVDQRVRNAPRTLRTHLLQDGYICIHTGLLSPDRFATTDQISDVREDAVWLYDDRDRLFTL